MSGGKPAARLGDIGSKHSKCSPTPIISGSGDVIINGKPAARVGDPLAPHCKHSRNIATGSSTVTVNGQAAARIGDAINCGGKVSTGSGNVTIGDIPSFTAPLSFNLPDINFRKQNGNRGKCALSSYHPDTMAVGEKVIIDYRASEIKEEVELKSIIVRLDIEPEKSLDINDQFILSSTDGSYRVVKTVKDDLIPGDGYLDLQYDNLDTSKLFSLEVDDGEGAETLLYAYNYASLSGFMPSLEEDDKQANNKIKSKKDENQG